MARPNFVTNYFFDYVNSEENKKRSYNTNVLWKRENITKKIRKSSLTSEGFEKIGFENLTEAEDKVIHPKSRSLVPYKNNEICSEMIDYKMKIYSNLLIERKKHYCLSPEDYYNKMESNEILETCENNNEDKENHKRDIVEVYIDSTSEILESYVHLNVFKSIPDENFSEKGKRYFLF